MSEKSEIATKDDQMVAALAHAGALIPGIGLLAPLLIWATQKDHSVFIKKQALQAVLWQGLELLTQFLFGICYIVGVFLMIPLQIYSDLSSEHLDPTASGGIYAVFPLPIMIIFGLLGISALFYYGFAVIGAVQSLQGKDFHYPFIGRWVEKHFSSEPAEQDQEDPKGE